MLRGCGVCVVVLLNETYLESHKANRELISLRIESGLSESTFSQDNQSAALSLRDDNMKNGSSKCPAISPMCDRQSDYNQINLLVAFIQAHSRTQPPPRPDQHPALTV